MAIIYVENEGGKLAVEVEGKGPLVVCSPGFGDTRDAFGPLSAQLVAAGYRVACVDLRGHGDSTADFKRYGDEATAEDYVAVIKALGGGPAVLAGASMSAAASVIAAAQHPDQVAGLIFLGGFLRNGGSDFMLSILKFAFWWPWGPYVWKSYAGTLWPGLGEKQGERAARSKALLTRPGRWAAFQATVAGVDHNRFVTPWLGRTQAPALVVFGEVDPDWADPAEEAKWMATNFTDAEILAVPEAGHAPMFERPNIVGPGVLRWLERIKFNKKGSSIAANTNIGSSTGREV